MDISLFFFEIRKLNFMLTIEIQTRYQYARGDDATSFLDFIDMANTSILHR